MGLMNVGAGTTKGKFEKIGSGSASGTYISFSKTLTGDVKYKSLLVVFGAGNQREQVPTFSLSSGSYAKTGGWTDMVGTSGTNGAVMAYEVTDFKLPLDLSIRWDIGSNSTVKLLVVYGVY